MNEPYVEPPVDPDTATRDNQILADLQVDWDAEAALWADESLDWAETSFEAGAETWSTYDANATRMEQLIHRQLIKTVRAMTIAGVVGTVLWFATVAGWLR